MNHKIPKITIGFKPRMITSLLLFTFLLVINGLIGQNDKNESLKSGVLADAEISKTGNYLYQKVKEVNVQWQKYQSKRNTQHSISDNQLVANTNKLLLFHDKISHQQLLFTKLDYESNRQLNKINYFYYGPYSRLQQEYFSLREKIKLRIAAPLKTNFLVEKIETIWMVYNYKITLSFKKEFISNNGVIFLSVIKVSDGQYVIPYQFSSEEVLSEKGMPSDSKNISNLSEIETTSKELEKENNLPSRIPGVGSIVTVYKKTSLRAIGKDDGRILARADSGDDLIILESESNYYWTKVRFKDLEGWIKTSMIKLKE